MLGCHNMTAQGGWFLPIPLIPGPECGWGGCPTIGNSSANQIAIPLARARATLSRPFPQAPVFPAFWQISILGSMSWPPCLFEVKAFFSFTQESLVIFILYLSSGPGTRRSLRVWSWTLPLPWRHSQAGALELTTQGGKDGWKEVQNFADLWRRGPWAGWGGFLGSGAWVQF